MSNTREKILKIHNELKGILTTIQECNDLWMSDIKKLEDILYTMRDEFNIEPQRDDEGNIRYYGDYVLGGDFVYGEE